MKIKFLSIDSLTKDIRSGVKESAILSKYNLTERQLEKTLYRLMKAGHLSDLEVMTWLRVTDSQIMRAFVEGSPTPRED